jgi:hypothetical protein
MGILQFHSIYIFLFLILKYFILIFSCQNCPGKEKIKTKENWKFPDYSLQTKRWGRLNLRQYKNRGHTKKLVGKLSSLKTAGQAPNHSSGMDGNIWIVTDIIQFRNNLSSSRGHRFLFGRKNFFYIFC